jgi:hypothetical protein
VNAFKKSGICPLNPRAILIDQSKLAPAMPYLSSGAIPSQLQAKKVRELESLMKPETIKLYEERLDEGYDIDGDELYSIWSKMKQLSISDNAPMIIPEKQQIVSPVMDEVLNYPNPAEKKTKSGRSTASMPRHLSSEQMVLYMEEKQAAKQQKEDEKQQRKEARQKKLEREIELKRKKEEERKSWQ